MSENSVQQRNANSTEVTANCVKRSGSDTNNSELPLVVQTFVEVIFDDGNNIYAICNLCLPIKNTVRSQHRAPSNFYKQTNVTTPALPLSKGYSVALASCSRHVETGSVTQG